MRRHRAGVTGLSNSTGNMMREMVLKGPSTFDALFVYENVAIDYLKNAEGRWGRLRVVYPDLQHVERQSVLHPRRALEQPTSSGRRPAKFLDFLMTEPVQKQSLVHGFRPGNPSVSIKAPDSPFVQLGRRRVADRSDDICEPPGVGVIANLLASWQRGTSR